MTRQKTTFTIVAICVLVLHAVALWALQRGLAMHRPEVVVPVHLLAQLVEPPRPIAPALQPVVTQQAVVPKPTPPEPKPRIAKPKPAPMVKPTQPKPETPQPVTPAPVLALEPAAEATATAAPATPAAQPEKSSAPSTSTAVAAAPPAPPSRPAPIPVELPSSDAHYLQNPRPTYPPMSLRLREQGTVLVDVLVSDMGLASEAKLKKSSGYFRLDTAAVSTVLTWRFVPGKRAGVAQAMWFTIPIAFTIQ
ncbi:MAG: TonB family protein [Burkholderiaceae bacterium]